MEQKEINKTGNGEAGQCAAELKKITRTELFKRRVKSLFTSQIFKGVVCGIGVAAIFFAGFFTNYFLTDEKLRSASFIIDIYEKHYYKADPDRTLHDIASGIMDRYSGYYTADEYQRYLRSNNGENAGFGISLSGLTVARVSGNSPAERAGIRSGGVIVGYKSAGDAQYTEDITSASLQAFLQAADKDTNVSLKIDYAGSVEQFTLKKSEYDEAYVYYTDLSGSYRFAGEDGKLELVRYADCNQPLSDGYSYLRLTGFKGLREGNLSAGGQVETALARFKQSGNKRLIFDLRGNGGGYLSVLYDIASHLCYSAGGGKMLCVNATYQGGRTEELYMSSSKYQQYGFEEIIFLADEGSASASEALMGAVLDYDKFGGLNIVKVVLEEHETKAGVFSTYGKGIMQSTYTNALTGEAVKLTTAEISWPLSKISIHDVGLTVALDSRIYNSVGDPVVFAQSL